MSGAQTATSDAELSLSEEADRFLWRVLRGALTAWPANAREDFTQAVLDRSGHHGVQSLIYARMESQPDWPGWPERVCAQLRAAARAEAAQDLLRGRALTEALAALAARGIPVLIIKGEALARTVYAHPYLRTRRDTDLFIHYRDIEAVRNTLAPLGFRAVPPIYKSHQFVCRKNWGEAAIDFDIHWRIQNAAQFARAISFDDAWSRSVAVPVIAGARTLGPVDSLLLACMHRSGSEFHDPDRLLWLYDIHLLAASLSDEDWIAFAQRAADNRVRAACLEGLLKAQACFATAIPSRVALALAPGQPGQRSAGRFSASQLALLIDDLRSLPGWRAKSSLLEELLFPSPEALMWKYHKTNRAWLPFLYLRQLLGGAAKRLTLQ